VAVFSYRAALPSGEISEGRMEAPDHQDVIRHLQAQGQITIRADEVVLSDEPSSRRQWFARRQFSQRDFAPLTVELSRLLQAGLPLDRSLKIQSEVMDRTESRQVIEDLHEAVHGGADLSAALSGYRHIFSDFYINMVRAGEAGGALAATLQQLGEFLEHAQDMKESVISRLIYPLVLLMVAGVSIVILLTYVIPQFSELFADAGADLPWLTRIVVNLGVVAGDYGWLVILLLIAMFYLFRQQYRQPQGRLAWDRLFLRLPLLSDFMVKLETARFTHALATLLKNGVPLLQAVRISRELISNRAIASDLERVLPALEAGEGLAAPLSQSHLVPALATHLIKVGEESGRLEDMLYRVASIFEREVDNALNRMLVLLEPALILGLGVFVAGIIMSILMAILSANELVF